MAKKLTNGELKKRLEDFQPLQCWKVGLSIGSIVYFYMGDKYKTKGLRGKVFEVGTVDLTLWGDDWEIFDQGKKIMDSEEVDREFVEQDFSKIILGQDLLNIENDPKKRVVDILFSNEIRIIVSHVEDGHENKDEDILVLFLPDGTILYSRNGFLFQSDEVSKERKQIFFKQN